MSTRFTFPAGSGTLATRERSKSAKMNATQNYLLSGLNSLDDDMVKVMGICGLSTSTPYQVVGNINYSSNRFVTDGTSLITAIGALDAASVGLASNNAFTGDNTFAGKLAVPNDGTLTLATGAVTVTGAYHFIDTEASAASDDLDTINGGANGQILVLQSVNNSRDVVVKHNTGNILLGGGSDITLGTTTDSIVLMYNATLTKWVEVCHSVIQIGFPKGYLGGPPPRYNDAASIIIPTGCRARNSTNVADIEATGDLTVSLAVSGANGLDTGAEANSTHYYVYLIKKSSDGTVAGLLSTVNEAVSGSVTMPSGYDLKRQLPYSVRNDGSGNIIPTVITGGWPYRPHVQFRDYEESATYRVLNAGTSTTFAAVSLAGLVPPISKLADLYVNVPNYGGGGIFIRATGSGLTDGRKVARQYSGDIQYGIAPDVITDASQSIDYKVAASGQTDLWVWGYTVTEVN